MIKTQYINLNMTPSGVMPVLYCSQYDVGRPLGMVVYNGGEAVDLGTYTCTIEATRSDGTAITAAVTTDGNVGAFATTATMTNQKDRYPAKLVLFDSQSRRVASLAFVMCVTPATMDENAVGIEEDASLYQQYTGTVQALIAEIREDLVDLSDHIDVVESIANSTPFSAERIFRIGNNLDATGESNVGGQSFTNTGSSFVVGSRVKSDNSVQKITEISLTGEIIRQKRLTSADLGHCNDICYDAENSLLYAVGTGTKIVSIAYSDFSIIGVKEITGCTSISSLDYWNGTLYARANTSDGAAIGTVDINANEFVPLIYYTTNEPNQTISGVVQGMAVYNGRAYLVMNRENQIVVFNLDKKTMERVIPVGEGNGVYPYGEIECATFVNGQMYLLTAVWYSNYAWATPGYVQAFKTSIGGPVYLHGHGGQGIAETFTIYVNGASTEATGVNPDGSSDNSFSTIMEACAFLMYQAGRYKDRAFELQIRPGASHDYSTDRLFLRNTTCYVRSNTGITFYNAILRNGTYFLRDVNTTNGISSYHSIVQLYRCTSNKLNSVYSEIVMNGTLNAFTEVMLEGSVYNPMSYAQYEAVSPSSVTSRILTIPGRQDSIASDHVSSNIIFGRTGNVVTVEIKGVLSDVATGTQTTLCSIPDHFLPATEKRFDVYTNLDSTPARLRVYVKPSGTLTIHNYNAVETSYNNVSINLTYIV